ncbi:MAG: pantoate--beta-alanine ligase [Xanthomonadaceae bacterium]|nr:pantoate--beta-alanine ligase [Xanthomonadaceae bacterium]
MTEVADLEVMTDLAALRRWRTALHDPVHFVPTMGNLHAGHLALVDRAACNGAIVLVSIFVNPAQFSPGEDFERYPRTLERDCRMLSEHGCNHVWAPGVELMYPLGQQQRFRIQPPSGLSSGLCGVHRPGHFEGVCDAVMRLFWQVRPDRAVFGEKDFQQLLIIRKLVEDYAVPIGIDAVPIVREADGLAMSSRNQYLDLHQRRRAPGFYRTLADFAERARHADPGTFQSLERSALERLEKLEFHPEYVEFRDAETLGPATGRNDRLFAAVRLGTTRLIDNVALTRQNVAKLEN